MTRGVVSCAAAYLSALTPIMQVKSSKEQISLGIRASTSVFEFEEHVTNLMHKESERIVAVSRINMRSEVKTRFVNRVGGRIAEKIAGSARVHNVQRCADAGDIGRISSAMAEWRWRRRVAGHKEVKVTGTVSHTRIARIESTAGTRRKRSRANKSYRNSNLGSHRAGGPPFWIFGRNHHDRGCPILAFFARVGTRDLYIFTFVVGAGRKRPRLPSPASVFEKIGRGERI